MATPTGELLKGLELEALVAVRLRSLGAEFDWRNESGETNSWPDFYVWGTPLDAKGSDKYEGSMYLGPESYGNDKARVKQGHEVWYVLNTLVVVSFPEIYEFGQEAWVCGKPGMKIIPPSGHRTLEEWVEERTKDEGSSRRRGELVLATSQQPQELVDALDGLRLAAAC